MRRSLLLVCLSLTLAVGTRSFAGDRIGVGVKVGTLGVGVDVTGRINNWFSVRGSLNAANVSRSYSETDVDYDGEFKLGAYGLLADFHPFRGNFRLTAGLMKNRNRADLTAHPTQDVKIGNTTYTPAEVGVLDGTVRFKDTVPYFGVGFGSAARGPRRVRFVFDLGVIEQGSGDVTIESSRNQVTQSDLHEEESKLRDKIKDYKLWPVIAFGISFRI